MEKAAVPSVVCLLVAGILAASGPGKAADPSGRERGGRCSTENEAEAGEWDDSARMAARNLDRDAAILQRLKALQSSDTEARRRELGELVMGDYHSLLCTLGPDAQEYAAALSPSGNTALLVRVPGLEASRLFRLWDTTTCLPAGDEIELPRGLYFNASMIDERHALVRYHVAGGPESAKLIFEGRRPRIEMLSESAADQIATGLHPAIVAGQKAFPAGIVVESWPEHAAGDQEPTLHELRVRSVHDHGLLTEPVAVGRHPGAIQVQVIANGSRLVTLEGGRVRTWNLRPNGAGARPAEPVDVVTAAFNETGTKLAAIVVVPHGQKRAELRVLDVASQSWQTAAMEDDAGHGHILTPASSMESIEFSSDARAIVLHRSDGVTPACVFDVATGRHLVPQWSFRPAAAARRREFRAIEFSPQLDKVVAAEARMTSGGVSFDVRVWDIARNRPLTPVMHAFSIDSVAFSRDGKTVALHTGEEVYAWNSTSKKLLNVTLRPTDDEGGVSSGMDVSQDGTRVMVQDEPSSWMLNVMTGHRRALTPSEEAGREWSRNPIQRHEGWLVVSRRSGGPVARYLPRLVAVRMSSDCELCAQIAVTSGDGIAVSRRSLAEAEGPSIAGDPSALLAEWSRKLTGR